MKNKIVLSLFVSLICLWCCGTTIAQNVRKQKIALASTSGNFLQCTCSVGGDGALHANNRHVNQEEAWWLWTVGDPNNHQVALGNYRNGYFMWRHGGGSSNHRARMTHDIGGDSTWTMVSGADYGLSADLVAFRAYDGAYLKAWQGGGHADAPGEGGEVYVDNGPPARDPNWVGWWRMSEVTFDPQPGNNAWISIGDGIYAGIRAVGSAIAFAFNGNPAPNNVPPGVTVWTASADTCSALPPVVDTGTDRYIHAYCTGVIPTDYPGRFYSSNEANAVAIKRVQCDIFAHHQVHPDHAMDVQICDAGMSAGPECKGVPSPK